MKRYDQDLETLTTDEIKDWLLHDFLLIDTWHHWMVRKNLLLLHGTPRHEDAMMLALSSSELNAFVPVAYRRVRALFRALGPLYQLEQPAVVIAVATESIHCQWQAKRLGSSLLRMARAEGSDMRVDVCLIENLNPLNAPMTKLDPSKLSAANSLRVKCLSERFELWKEGRGPFPDATEVGGPKPHDFLAQVTLGEREAIASAREIGAVALFQILTTSVAGAAYTALTRQLKMPTSSDDILSSNAGYGEVIVHQVGRGAINYVAGPYRLGATPPPFGSLLDMTQAREGD